MKKSKTATKRAVVSKKTTAKKYSPARAATKKATVVKAKTSNIKKKPIKSRQKTNAKPLKAFVAAIFAVAIVAICAVAGPGVWSAITSNNKVLGSETTPVTEDQLAMFATLSYEDATHKQVNASGVLEPVAKDANGNPISFAVCNGVRGSIDLRNEVVPSTQVKDCMTNPSKYSSNFADNMFNTADYMGNDHIILPDNASVGDKIINVTADIMADIIKVEKGELYYFNNLISTTSVKQSFLSNWIAVDYYDQSTAGAKYFGKISAITFMNPTTKEIVISYRGTDLTDTVDWLEDLMGYGLFDNTGQDSYAANYAKYIADIYSAPDYKIYTTGHSLGGYLAEVGGAKLLNVNPDGISVNPGNLKRIVYFNGMGLFPFKPTPVLRENPEHVEMANKFLLWNTANSKAGNKILLVHMNGDPVSSVGVHYGQIKTLHASHDVAATYNKRYSDGMNTKLADLVTTTQGALHTFVQNVINLNPRYKDMTLQQIITEGPLPARWKWLVTNDGSGLAGLTSALKSVARMNVNTSTWSSAWRENDSKAFLGWMMTVHPTDSFFYTTTYYNICINGSDKANCAYVANKFTPPTQTSIDSIAIDTTTTTVYNQTACTFTVTPATVIKGENTTGKITCSDPDGLRDDIDTSKITEEYGYFKITVGSVTAISDNDLNTQSWNVVLTAKTGAEHPAGNTWMWVDKGFVKDTYGQTNKSVKSNQITTQNSRPRCTFTVTPSSVRRGSSTNGVITCADKDGINNASMNKSKITEEYAHFKMKVGNVTEISDNDPTTQSWNVALTAKDGIFNLLGDTWMWADMGFVKDVSGFMNYSVQSNKITTIR